MANRYGTSAKDHLLLLLLFLFGIDCWEEFPVCLMPYTYAMLITNLLSSELTKPDNYQ